MARSKNTLNEMEAKNAHSVTQVNRGAAPAEPMQKLTTGGMETGYEDLGGPTPENSKPDDNSNALKDPSSRLKRVSDAITRGARAAEPMQKMNNPVSEETEDDDEEFLDEDESDEDELYEEKDEDDEDEEDEDEDEDEEEVTEKKGKKKEKEDAEDSMNESDEYDEDDYDLEDDVEALVAGEDLSEEFKEKTRVIYEAAVRSKVSEIRDRLEEQYEAALVEEVQEIAESLQERLDAYLEYVSEEWMQENELAIQYGIREQIAESFLGKLFNLFEEHNVTLPEEKYDVVENMQLTQKLSESVADKIFDDVADGLAITQQEKLASLAESVEFEGADTYREKLMTLRESYFPQNRRVLSAQLETLSEGMDVPQGSSYSPAMESYLRAAAAVAKV
jgi:hypothetical protein